LARFADQNVVAARERKTLEPEETVARCVIIERGDLDHCDIVFDQIKPADGKLARRSPENYAGDPEGHPVRKEHQLLASFSLQTASKLPNLSL
jgi:hypothetical protein